MNRNMYTYIQIHIYTYTGMDCNSIPRRVMRSQTEYEHRKRYIPVFTYMYIFTYVYNRTHTPVRIYELLTTNIYTIYK